MRVDPETPAPPLPVPPLTPPSRTRYASYALGVLTAVNLLNYLERNAIFALFEPLKRDVHLSDAQLGWLGSAYVLVFSLASLPLGLLGDLRSRRGVIAGGIAVWSVATSLSGLVQGFNSLFLARALVGLGGAAAAAAAASLVADYFAERDRALAMGVYMTGLALGGILGILIAGQLEAIYGWRVAFFALGLPGFGLAALVVRLPDPTRSAPQGGLGRGHPIRQGSGLAIAPCLPGPPPQSPGLLEEGLVDELAKRDAPKGRRRHRHRIRGVRLVQVCSDLEAHALETTAHLGEVQGDQVRAGGHLRRCLARRGPAPRWGPPELLPEGDPDAAVGPPHHRACRAGPAGR